MTWKRVLSLGAVFSLVGSAVVAVTVVLPGRGSELARRLQHEWSFGELELGPPVRVDAKTIEFPFFRVSDQRGDVALEATSVRWRRPGVLPTRAGLSIDDSVVEFTHALLNAHCDDRGRWNLSGLGEVRGLPGRVLGKRAVVQLSTHSGRSAELEILSPVLRRSSDLLEFEGSVVGASWAEGTLRAQRSPTRWSCELHLDDVDPTRFPFELASEVSPPWPSSVRWERGRLDVDWQFDSRRRRVLVECYQSSIAVPSFDAEHSLRFVRGGASIENGVVAWRLDRATFSRSAISGEGELGPQRSKGVLRLTNVARDRQLAQLLPSFWAQIIGGTPWSGEVDAEVVYDGVRGGRSSEMIREIAVRTSAFAPRGSERATAINGTASLVPDGPSWRIDVRATLSRCCGLSLPEIDLSGVLSSTNLELQSRDSRIRLKAFEWNPKTGSFRVFASAKALPMGSMFGRDLGDAEWELQELDAKWQRNLGWTWTAKLEIYDLELPDSVEWPWGGPGRQPLNGVAVLSGERGGVRVSYLSLDDDRSRWELAGDIGSDGACRLEGSRLPLQKFRFRPHLVPLEGAASFEVRGPVFGWEIQR